MSGIWSEDYNPYDTDAHERAPGCVCTWEEGDSPCPVHGEDEPSQSGDQIAPDTAEPAEKQPDSR